MPAIPRPAKQGAVQAFGPDGPISVDDVAMNGWLFTDGHCSCSPCLALRRASWAVACISHEWPYPVRSILRGPVWSSLPQSAPSVEYTAFAAAVQVADADFQVVMDCQAVPDHTLLPPVQRLQRKRMYAAIYLDAMKQPGMRHLRGAFKVKSHQDHHGFEQGSQIQHSVFANGIADTHADLAESLHPTIPESVIAAVHRDYEIAYEVCRLMALHLAFIPEA